MSKIYRHSDGTTRDYPEATYELGSNKAKYSPVIYKVTEKLDKPEMFDAYYTVDEVIAGEEARAKEKQGGSKNDSNKPRLELIPTEFLIEVAKALTFGANKYSDDNFRLGLSYKRLLGAAKRHIEQELAGIEADNESGLSHLAHAGASLAMYAFMKAHRPDLDDRYKYTEEQMKKIEEMMYGTKPE